MSKRMLVFAVFITSLTAAAQNDDYEYAGDDGQQQFSQAPPSEAYGNAQLPQSAPGPTLKSVDQFTQPLSAYGSWVSEDGVNAFQPSTRVVGSDFTPYASQGQWVATSAGWEFQSSLPFSWATYHYGRWYQSPRYGWVWVPDTQWAPSWVEWRYGRPSYSDWGSRYGQRCSSPRVTGRYQQPTRVPPPAPTYWPPRGGGFHSAPPPPPPRFNGGGFGGGRHRGGRNHDGHHR